MGIMDAILKAAPLVIKCPDPESEGRTGAISMDVATLDVVDRDWEIIASGSVGRQDVMISPFQHGLGRGQLPIGRGVLYEAEGKLKFDGQLNMELQTARDTWASLEPVADLVEVSFGFLSLKRDWVEQDSITALRHLELKAKEVSPVIVGAGIGTGITGIKAHQVVAHNLPTAAVITAAFQLQRITGQQR